MSKRHSVLIVEDEAVLQDVYKLILSNDYEVHTANNGVEGLQKLEAVKPDLLLLDIFMPVMDGKELMRNLDLNNHKAMKIIVYSNLSDKDSENEMRKLGAHAFLLKSSMTPADLLSTVSKHLKKKA